MTVPEDVHEGEKTVEALQIELYHLHLPQLEVARFIRWNRNTLEVEKGSKFDEIRPLLELMHKHVDELPDDWL